MADYDIAAIRSLMLDAFTAEELERFCQERPAFDPVRDEFGPRFSFNDMIDATLDYCDRQRLLPDLLAEIEQLNPRQYARYRDRLLQAEPPPAVEQQPSVLARAWAWLVARAHRNRHGLRIGAGLVVLAAIVAAVAIGVPAYLRQRQQPKYWADCFLNTTSPDRRLTCLAGLIRLQDKPYYAQYLFFDRLDPEERVAMFAVSDPKGMEADLALAIAALYTRLDNDPHGDDLLQAMATALAATGLSTDEALKLSLEIEQWQAGRARYAAGEYLPAIRAYTLAVGQNDENSATYLERALAYIGVISYSRALDDLLRAHKLDAQRRGQIKAIITADSGLLAYLWKHSSSYADLLSGVPTLTPTPRPTHTPTPVHTSTPARALTPTPTPALMPTSTPLPAPSF